MALIYFLLVLSVLVLVHEAGHFFIARLFGVKADEFGYGFPPRLIGFVKEKGRWKKVGRKDNTKYSNTIWSINWLPLGGFVRIKGEQPGEEDGKDSFHNHPIWQRVAILAAGVCMNWLTAIVLFSIVFMVGTNAVLEDLPASARVTDKALRITQVLSGSPADQAGLKPQDKILEVKGQAPADSENARQLIAKEGQTPFVMTVEREGERKDVSVAPAYVQEVGRVALGIGMAEVGHVSFSPPQAIWTATLATGGYTRAILVTFYEMIRDLISRRGVSTDIAGPVGIAVVTGEIAQQGIIPLLQFAAVLSINLAVVNFLPIPALDGGRVLFLAIEKLRRRAMNRNLEAAIHNVAFLLLIVLIAVVTVRDISHYGGTIMSGLKGFVGK